MIHSIKKLALLFILLLLFSACSNTPKTENQHETYPAASEEERVGYLNSKGYNVIESEGIVSTYVLERDMLKNMEYGMIWGLQYIDPNQYIGNEIDIYEYNVKNHHLDYLSDKRQTNIWLIVCNDEIVGGYSAPNCTVEKLGGVLALDGESLEEVTGLSYKKWNKKWMKEYQ